MPPCHAFCSDLRDARATVRRGCTCASKLFRVRRGNPHSRSLRFSAPTPLCSVRSCRRSWESKCNRAGTNVRSCARPKPIVQFRTTPYGAMANAHSAFLAPSPVAPCQGPVFLLGERFPRRPAERWFHEGAGRRFRWPTHVHPAPLRRRVLVTVVLGAPSSTSPAAAPPASSSIDTTALEHMEGAPVADEVSDAQYVPLHVHSDFSLLDGASHIPDLVRRASELNVPALALTDHGVLYGAIGLVRHCQDADPPVKPIIGNEMYVVNVDLPYVPDVSENEANADAKVGKRGPKQKHPRRYHLIVLAKDTTGYQNLVKLTTMAHLHGKVGTGIFSRPCVNKAMLYEHREGLIVSSACLGGEVAQAILQDKPDIARQVARWYRDVFGDDYYLEIQDHGSDEDRKVNREVVKIGRELSIPVLATNDSHFTSCLDAEAHDALICIQTGKTLDEENRLRYAGNEYFKSVEEMRQCFVDHLGERDIDDALRNTLGVANKVGTYDLFDDTRIPDFPIPPCPSSGDYDEKSHGSYLRHVARKGNRERFTARLSSGLLKAPNDFELSQFSDLYDERLEFELDMIERMGFASYFLVVWDYIRFARSEGVPVGPGRGSAAGSLVAFALRITDVDPIQYSLLFERFLNPERKSMPDIDTDFSVEGREKIIRYVTEKYGSDCVAQIITFNRLTSKAVLKDVARVHKVPYSQADKLAKLIPVSRGKPASLTDMLNAVPAPSAEFKSIVTANPEYEAWIDKARRIEGTNKTFGIHAAGVVISATPLTTSVPLSKAKHGETITQYAMEDVEALGLLKMDFLGLKTLSIIESAVGFVNSRRRHSSNPLVEELDFSVDTLPLDDQKTYDFLAVGELDGIFQLDASAGMRNIVRELKPSNLEDISSVLALYRPGPLDAGLIPSFIKRKHGKESIRYDHPMLEPILKETYGVMVYQEQIMRIARDLAGYSLGQADILRRAMGKKKKDVMAREKPRFVEGAFERGVPKHVAAELFETMTLFAEYCFNKSHSTAYAYLTYQTAYLKANFPVEHAAALLKANSNQSDKLTRYLADANANGVRVAPPSVNRSELNFSVAHVRNPKTGLDEFAVLFGLHAIKTVGDSVGCAIIEEREKHGPYSSIIDLIERLDSRLLNVRALNALVLCGAFDELHPNRRVLHEQLDSILKFRRKVRDKRKRREKKELTLEEEAKAAEQDAEEWETMQLNLAHDSETQEDFSVLKRLAGEKAMLGFYASGHPLQGLESAAKRLDTTPIPLVLGESVTGEDAEADTGDEVGRGMQSHGDLKDGSEVMVLSLVTEMKKMVTSRGKNMAKWHMEDVTSRVSAVVFPAGYALCEEVVGMTRHAKQPSTANKTAQAGDDEEEREYVIADDARVVVWGKVDRESSGTTQVIVDDVQRIEDVHMLTAVVPYSAGQSEKMAVGKVRYYVQKLMDPSSIYERNGGDDSYIYTDKSGNQVKGRRRRKAIDLSTKPRIPVVVQQLKEDGSVAGYTYAGHACRMRYPSDEDLKVLLKDTGFVFKLESAILPNSFTEQDTPTSVVEPRVDNSEFVEVTEPGCEKLLHRRQEAVASLGEEAVETLQSRSSSSEKVAVGLPSTSEPICAGVESSTASVLEPGASARDTVQTLKISTDTVNETVLFSKVYAHESKTNARDGTGSMMTTPRARKSDARQRALAALKAKEFSDKASRDISSRSADKETDVCAHVESPSSPVGNGRDMVDGDDRTSWQSEANPSSSVVEDEGSSKCGSEGTAGAGLPEHFAEPQSQMAPMSQRYLNIARKRNENRGSLGTPEYSGSGVQTLPRSSVPQTSIVAVPVGNKREGRVSALAHSGTAPSAIVWTSDTRRSPLNDSVPARHSPDGNAGRNAHPSIPSRPEIDNGDAARKGLQAVPSNTDTNGSGDMLAFIDSLTNDQRRLLRTIVRSFSDGQHRDMTGMLTKYDASGGLARRFRDVLLGYSDSPVRNNQGASGQDYGSTAKDRAQLGEDDVPVSSKLLACSSSAVETTPSQDESDPTEMPGSSGDLETKTALARTNFEGEITEEKNTSDASFGLDFSERNLPFENHPITSREAFENASLAVEECSESHTDSSGTSNISSQVRVHASSLVCSKDTFAENEGRETLSMSHVPEAAVFDGTDPFLANESSGQEIEQRSVGVSKKKRRPRKKLREFSVDWRKEGISGLVDTICFAASDVAAEFAGESCVLTWMDKFALPENKAEGILIVSASVGATDGSLVHLYVSVREKYPTGNRSRIRNVGSVVVTMCASKPVPIYEAATAKALKVKDTLEERLNENPEIMPLASDGGSVIHKLLVVCPEKIQVCSLMDGGKLIRWMCIAAERAVHGSLDKPDLQSEGENRVGVQSINSVTSDFVEERMLDLEYTALVDVRVDAQVRAREVDGYIVDVTVNIDSGVIEGGGHFVTRGCIALSRKLGI